MAKILTIDTSNNKKIIVGLEVEGKKSETIEDSTILKSEAVLPVIEKILQKNNSDLSQITEVAVKRGPGSFTGLRVGMAVANALSFLLKVPVNGKRVGELEEPVYNE